MRRVAVVLLLAGCPLSAGPNTGECEGDSDCGGNVCARDGFCYPKETVRGVKTTWTIKGQTASPTTCGPVTSLMIAFTGDNPGDAPLMYAPVPCEIGQWVMDKLPDSYTLVELGKENGFAQTKTIGAANTVAFDLTN
ncbi:MAG: hypothetical protein M4D80_39005 [Myxococcota bacterium]|nr:hypothetical protein [Deltaproteobacteria bacterium]MDQ3341181.1 hypothetical protein [Myxococcota bacterium]